jgi:Ca2+/Na+ antiporter
VGARPRRRLQSKGCIFMGSLISKAFIPPSALLGCTASVGVDEDDEAVVECLSPFSEPDWYWGLIQVMTLVLLYGYVLFYASNMLSEGSELLLLVPSLAGIVGSVVLPILGAVPDGAIMLFSGLGPDAQNQLTVGVGALAGSTIMLLTVPWGLSIIYGSVPIGPNGQALYGKAKRNSMHSRPGGSSMMDYGVTPGETIRTNAFLMVATSLIYLVIQGPAFAYAKEPNEPSVQGAVASTEHWYALIGLILASISFFAYIFLMTKQSESSASTQEYIVTQVG